jgi:hypothetical protein
VEAAVKAKIDPTEAAQIAIESGALISVLSQALRKDDDGVVRFSQAESREIVRRLLSVARAITLALLD